VDFFSAFSQRKKSMLCVQCHTKIQNEIFGEYCIVCKIRDCLSHQQKQYSIFSRKRKRLLSNIRMCAQEESTLQKEPVKKGPLPISDIQNLARRSKKRALFQIYSYLTDNQKSNQFSPQSVDEIRFLANFKKVRRGSKKCMLQSKKKQ
jgi:hypothetical protein